MAEVNTKAESALKDNQQKKGEYSYYYAHQSGSGDQISTPTSAHVPTATTKASTDPSGDEDPAPKKIDSYQWCDNDEKGVQVFVKLPGIGKHPPESIQLNHTEDSMTLDLKDFGGVAHQQLELLLKKKISGARLKQKPDKLLITLAKLRPKTKWYTLTRKDTEAVDTDYYSSSSSSSEDEAEELAGQEERETDEASQDVGQCDGDDVQQSATSSSGSAEEAASSQSE